MNLYNQLTNGTMGGNAPTTGNPYLERLQQQLDEARKMQQQFNPNANAFNQPQQQQVQQQQVQQPQVQQPNVSPEGQAVLMMFEEFARTEDGKQLVSYMGKFNSYCQSMIAKAQNNSGS